MIPRPRFTSRRWASSMVIATQSSRAVPRCLSFTARRSCWSCPFWRCASPSSARSRSRRARRMASVALTQLTARVCPRTCRISRFQQPTLPPWLWTPRRPWPRSTRFRKRPRMSPPTVRRISRWTRQRAGMHLLRRAARMVQTRPRVRAARSGQMRAWQRSMLEPRWGTRQDPMRRLIFRLAGAVEPEARRSWVE